MPNPYKSLQPWKGLCSNMLSCPMCEDSQAWPIALQCAGLSKDY